METPTITTAAYGTASMFGDPAADFRARRVPGHIFHAAVQAATPQQQKEDDSMSTQRRLVRVMMVDPHPDVPMDHALLHDSKEVFTDKDDRELFFDMPVAELLRAHNAKRVTWPDKAVKDRVQMLEPVRIRDLKMHVIEIAKF